MVIDSIGHKYHPANGRPYWEVMGEWMRNSWLGPEG